MTDQQAIAIVRAVEAQTIRIVDAIRWTNMALLLIFILLIGLGFALRH